MTMITGGHSIIYCRNPEGDRAFLRDVLKLTNVDVGEGWLIFGLPPAEVAVHPSDENDVHEFYLMCDDVQEFLKEMGRYQIACDPVQDRGWGLLTNVTLPGGGKLGVYQPRHARPAPVRTKTAKTASAAKRPGGKRGKKSRKRTPRRKSGRR